MKEIVYCTHCGQRKEVNAGALRAVCPECKNRYVCETDAYKIEKILTSLAWKKKPIAQYYLGLCYKNGECVKPNKKKAFYGFLASAKRGNKLAMLELVECYRKGRGVGKSRKKVDFWLDQLEIACDPHVEQDIEGVLEAENLSTEEYAVNPDEKINIMLGKTDEQVVQSDVVVGESKVEVSGNTKTLTILDLLNHLNSGKGLESIAQAPTININITQPPQTINYGEPIRSRYAEYGSQNELYRPIPEEKVVEVEKSNISEIDSDEYVRTVLKSKSGRVTESIAGGNISTENALAYTKKMLELSQK